MLRWPELRLAMAALLALSAPGVGLAQTQRPPEVIALQAGGEDCSQLRNSLGSDGVWVSRYRVNGGPATNSGASYVATGEACFRSIQQCERFLTEVALDYQLADAIGDCRKGK